MTQKEASLVPINNLAYYGDVVIERLVRKRIIENVNSKNPSLRSLSYVTAPNQAKAFERIESMLTEDECDIYKRGRNCVHGNVPKHSTMVEYRKATGFECLFGYLDLSCQEKRIEELFAVAYPNNIEEIEGTKND